MRYLLALVALIFAVANPAYAKWPTAYWTIVEGPAGKPTDPKGERKLMAEKHKESLERGSIWFQSMSFKAAYQLNDEGVFTFKGNEHYLAFLKSDTSDITSYHDSNGFMELSTYPRFLTPEYYKNASIKPLPPGSTECGVDTSGDQWLTEAAASAVQVQYLERT